MKNIRVINLSDCETVADTSDLFNPKTIITLPTMSIGEIIYLNIDSTYATSPTYLKVQETGSYIILAPKDFGKIDTTSVRATTYSSILRYNIYRIS